MKNKRSIPDRVYLFITQRLGLSGIQVGLIALAILAIQSIVFSILSTTHCDPTIPCTITNQSVNIKHVWTICSGIFTAKDGMLIHGDKLIIADYTRDGIIAFDLATGDFEWKTPMRGMWTLTLDIPRNRIYTYTSWGDLREIYALDATTGSIVWYNGEQNKKRDGYSPFLLHTGRLIAKATLSGTVRNLDEVSGVLGEEITIVSHRIYEGYGWQTYDDYLIAADAMTGDIFWQAREPVAYVNRNLRNIQLNDEFILVQVGDKLTVFDFLSGQILWQTRDLEAAGFATLVQRTVSVLDAEASFHMFNALDGSEVGIIQFQPPASGHDRNSVGSYDIGSSVITSNNEFIAVYFGDTNMLSVYQIQAIDG